MKALTLHQPYAELVAQNVKYFETRSWNTKYRGLLAIHASRDVERNGDPIIGWQSSPDGKTVPILKHPWGKYLPADYSELYMELGNGSVECIVELVDVFPAEKVAGQLHRQIEACRREPELQWVADQAENQLAFGDFSAGRFAWYLKHITRVSCPGIVRGRQGLWNLQADVERQIWPQILANNIITGGTYFHPYTGPRWQLAERSEAA